MYYLLILIMCLLWYILLLKSRWLRVACICIMNILNGVWHLLHLRPPAVIRHSSYQNPTTSAAPSPRQPLLSQQLVYVAWRRRIVFLSLWTSLTLCSSPLSSLCDAKRQKRKFRKLSFRLSGKRWTKKNCVSDDENHSSVVPVSIKRQSVERKGFTKWERSFKVKLCIWFWTRSSFDVRGTGLPEARL